MSKVVAFALAWSVGMPSSLAFVRSTDQLRAGIDRDDAQTRGAIEAGLGAPTSLDVIRGRIVLRLTALEDRQAQLGQEVPLKDRFETVLGVLVTEAPPLAALLQPLVSLVSEPSSERITAALASVPVSEEERAILTLAFTTVRPRDEAAETGRTFIAVTAPGMTIDGPTRKLVDSKANILFPKFFEQDQTVQFGPSTPSLKEQAATRADSKLGSDAQKAYQALVEDADKIGGSVAEQFKSRRLVLFTNDNDPALWSDGEMHLVGLSGNYQWRGKGSPGSHYAKLSLFQYAPRALGSDGALAFRQAWIRHETHVLNVVGYFPPTDEAALAQWKADERTLNEGFIKINAEFLVDEAAKDAKRFRVTALSANLGKYLGDPEILPDAVVDAAHLVLDDAVAKGQITDSMVIPNGGKLVVVVSHNRGHENPAIFALQQRAFSAALTAGAVAMSQNLTRELAEAKTALTETRASVERRSVLMANEAEKERDADRKKQIEAERTRLGGVLEQARARVDALVREAAKIDPQRMEAAREIANKPSDQQAIDLELQPLEFALTERNSDPMFMILTQNTAEGALNEMIWKFAVENPSQGRIENVPGYKFQVSDVHEQRLGGATRQDLFFDTVQGGGQTLAAMRGVAAAPEGWAIRRVDPADFPGRRAPNEPLLVVSGERVGGGKARNTMAIGRGQSGYLAVGEWLQRFTEAGFVTGGENNQHLVSVRPMTLSEIAKRVPKNQAGVAVIEWQTFQNGRFRPIKDGVSHSQHLQIRRDKVDQPMYEWFQPFPEMQEFDPYTLVDAAQERARRAREANRDRFITLPVPGSDDYASNIITRLIERANQASGGRTKASFKIDVGGDPGHQEPPVVYVASLNASIQEAIESGLIIDGRAYAIGDDVQIDITHTKGVNNAEIHSFAWYTFMRAAWIARVLNRKPYGWAQDLPIFKAGKTEEQLLRDVSAESNLTPRFISLLSDEIRKVGEEEARQPLLHEQREPVAEDLTVLATWWTHYQAGRLVRVQMVGGELNIEDVKGVEGAAVFTGPPAGNVTGQGIGFVEVPLVFVDGKPVEVNAWGLDKAGPGAFNWPVYFAIYYGKYFEQEIDEFMSLFQVAQEPNAAFTKAWLSRELEKLWARVKIKEQEIAAKGEDILQEAPDLPIVLEAWDTRNKETIFLDAEKDRKLMRDLLVAENWFSPRRVWIKAAGKLFDPTDPEQLLEALQAIFEADFSTERLAEAAHGAYIGKDDPKALMSRRFFQRIAFFVALHGWLIQGDERGSHNGDPTPGAPLSADPARRPIPTVRSYPVQAAISYTVNSDLKFAKVVDVFDNPTFEARRELSVKMNEVVLGKNEFPPQGVSPGKLQKIPEVKLEARVVSSTDKPLEATLVMWSGDEGSAIAMAVVAQQFAEQIPRGAPDVLVRAYERRLEDGNFEIGITLNGPRAIEIADIAQDYFAGYHGKVEVAYPLAQAVAETVAKGSKYVKERDVTIMDAVREAKLAPQYDTIGDSLSPTQVRQAADVTVTKTVLIHPTAFGEGPLAERLERWLKDQARQLHESSVDEAVKHSAIKLMIEVPPVVVDTVTPQVREVQGGEYVGKEPLPRARIMLWSAETPDELRNQARVAASRAVDGFGAATVYESDEGGGIQIVGGELQPTVQRLLERPQVAERVEAFAKERVAQFFKDLKSDLKPEWFTVVTSAPSDITMAMGPSDWLRQTAGAATVKVAVERPTDDENKVSSVVAAFDAGLEAAAAPDKKLPPLVAKKYDGDVAEQNGLFFAMPRNISGVVGGEVRLYRITARAAVQKV